MSKYAEEAKCDGWKHNYQQPKQSTKMIVGPFETQHIDNYVEDQIFCTKCGDVKQI